MPESAECQRLRNRLRSLDGQVTQVLRELQNEPLAARREQLQRQLADLQDRIDATKAQMDDLGCGFAPNPPPPLEEFGHATMLVNGTVALGERRLLLLLQEFTSPTADPYLKLTDAHPLDYYEKLAFGHQTPPFSTDNPVNPASLTDFVEENSLGRFRFIRHGTLGPMPMGVYANFDDRTHTRTIVQRLADLYPSLAFPVDDDHNAVVTSDELVVLVVDNIRDRMPANRGNLSDPIPFTVQGSPATSVSLEFISLNGHYTPFFYIAHESLHSLGALDIYGNDGDQNRWLSLMAGGLSGFSGNVQDSLHLDVWHKFVLGWCEPRLRNLADSALVEVVEISHARPDGAVLLYGAKGGSEYFLVERRRADGARRYDLSFPGDGVLIWYVDRSSGLPTHLGAPGLASGGSGIWQTGMRTPPLHWSDGTLATGGLDIGAGAGGAITVSW